MSEPTVLPDRTPFFLPGALARVYDFWLFNPFAPAISIITYRGIPNLDAQGVSRAYQELNFFGKDLKLLRFSADLVTKLAPPLVSSIFI